MLLYALLIIFFIVVVILYYKHVSYAKWHSKPLHNFPFIYKGKKFWYSRSVAVAHIVLGWNNDNQLCVLANKRGKGTPDSQGLWNCPCGYLDFDESGVEAAQRETFEETELYIKKENIHFFDVNSSPTANRQNVTIHYYSELEGHCEDYKLSSEHSEFNEVEEIKWIPIEEVDNYSWAFHHNDLIKRIINNIKNNR